MSHSPGRPPLLYAFANDATWAGTEWLAGPGALAGAVRELLELLRATGAKGNLFCDGIGLERLAAEAPEVLAELRAALEAGAVEVVGGTYGAPAGLFHGGESNVRQRVLGARAARRLLGRAPRIAWEAPFAFFPQLPQLLVRGGARAAALCYAPGWSTPGVPLEEEPLILWEGLDGTRIPALARTALCSGPRPEELDAALAAGGPDPADAACLQWLALRAEPEHPFGRKALAGAWRAAGRRFELCALTASELLAALAERAEPAVRAYTLDDAYHGASLGKNGDYVPRFSRMAEEQLLAAEAAASLASLFGRPYAGWDVYPSFELGEAWRELCAAQSHEVHEREGLLGELGERAFERSLGLSGAVLERTLAHLARRIDAQEGESLVFNPLGWMRDVPHQDGVVRDVPPYGYKVVDPYDLEPSPLGQIEMFTHEDTLELVRGDFVVTIDRARGTVLQIKSETYPDGLLDPERPLGELALRRGGERDAFETVALSSDSLEEGEFAEFVFLREGRAGSRVRVIYSLSPLMDALWVRFQAESLARPDPGPEAGIATEIAPAFAGFELVHDHPYGISTVEARADRERIFPAGPWESAPLVRERLRAPFSALSFVDLLALDAEGRGDGSGLLVVHDGSQAWSRGENGVRALLSMHDPWDGEHWDDVFEAELFFVPHGPVSDTERAMISMELNLGSPRFEDHAVVRGGGALPTAFGALEVDAESVLATALYRETRAALDPEPGHFAATVRDPLVVRLVEFDGAPAQVALRVPGAVARAARTTPDGAVLEELAPKPCAAPWGPPELPWSELALALAPREIATVMLDLELGRSTPLAPDVQARLWVKAPG